MEAVPSWLAVSRAVIVATLTIFITHVIWVVCLAHLKSAGPAGEHDDD